MGTKHGLNDDQQWAALAAWIEQGGECAICGHSAHSRRFVLDHDRKTGKVRGHLCIQCNTMLSMAYHSPKTLLAGIKYLRRGKK